MANLTLRNIKGSPLTNGEVDANFTALNDTKQDLLVSGANIKTINGATILGTGDVSITGLPTQTGNDGKFLTTNGTIPSWTALGSIAIQNANSVAITGGTAVLSKLDLFFSSGTSQLRLGTSNNYYWDVSRDNDTTGDLVISNKNGTTITERLRLKSNGALGFAGENFGTSGQVLTSSGDGATPTWESLNLSWTAITNKPTTLSGFGITDAQEKLVSGTNIKTVNGVSVLGSGDIETSVVSDDTTTNSTFYPTLVNATSGNFGTVKVSSTKLTFNPNTGELGATVFNSTSDERLKENIQPIDTGLNIIESLSGKTFSFKGSGEKSSGFIAQEIRKVIPHVVSAQETGYLSVNYDAVIPYLVEAVKELSQENKKLKAEIVTLATEISAQKGV